MSRVRQARHEDIKRIKEMCDEYISQDFYSEEELNCAVNDSDQYIVLNVNDEDVPAAFIYMFVAEYRKAKNILKIPEGVPELAGLADEQMVGVFKTTATDVKYRRNGILDVLIRECEKLMTERNVPVILLDALKLPSGRVPAKTSIQRNLFRQIAEIDRPWSDRESYCPYCGNNYCTCNAVLYIKEIDKDGKEE